MESGSIRGYAASGGFRLRHTDPGDGSPGGRPVSLLDILLLIPLAGFLGALTLPQMGVKFVRLWALFVSLVAFIVSLGIAIGYQPAVKGQQFIHDMVWIVNPEVNTTTSVSTVLVLWLVLLTTLLTPIAVLLSWNSITRRAKEFFACLAALEFGLIESLSPSISSSSTPSGNSSWSPMYLIIGIWGGEHRIYAAVKFFVYTMAGSLLMLGAIIYLTNLAGTSNYSDIVDGFVNGKLRPASAGRTAALPRIFPAVFAIKFGAVPRSHLVAGCLQYRSRGWHHDALWP